MNRVVSDLYHPIQPWGIKTERLFVGAFGSYAMEYTARLIIIHLKMREQWEPFSLAQITQRFPEETKSPHYDFDLLVQKGFVVEVDYLYCVTDDFIRRCHKASITPRGS